MKASYQVNQSLQALNTFGINAHCAYFSRITEASQLTELQSQLSVNGLFVLGGGSNILLPDYLNAWVLKMDIEGVTVLSENKHEVKVRVGAGLNWHRFVLYALDHGWGGLENLSLIPGTVGAAPIQNIGAYGVEVEQFIDKVHGCRWGHQQAFELDRESCRFGYRDSIFKNDWKGQTVITHVDFRLPKMGQYELQLEYGAIRAKLADWDIQNASAKAVSDAVIAIRQSKLPDPDEIGNAGSFFKNPVVDQSVFEAIQKEHPSMPFYPVHDSAIKIPAGWLIEQCGWKGRREGPVGCYQQQALVIVNHGGASSKAIKEFARKIQESVFRTFGIQLEREVNYISFP